LENKDLNNVNVTDAEIEARQAGSDEYSQGAVPMSQRKGFFSLVFVWIGYVFTVTIMTAGGQIALGSPNFLSAVKALALGYAILITIGITVGIISMKTGMTFGLLSRYTFGNLGSIIVSLAVMVTLLGWFSINCHLIGSITNALFPAVPQIPISIVAGILMTYTALKGVKIMNKIGMVATILVVAFGILSIVLAVKDAGGWASLIAIQQTDVLPFNKVVTIAVGSVVCGAVAWTPDVMRFAKTKGTAAAVMLVSLGICAPFMILIGIIGMLVYGESDIAFILQAQSLLAPAWFAMIANIWSTAQGNVYSSSLNLANIFTKVPRTTLVIIFGGVGTIAGLLGLYNYFGSWLSFLASTFPALGGVIIADYFITYNVGKRYPDLKLVHAHYPKFVWISIVAVAAGIVVNFTVNWGISTINAFVVAFIVQTILTKIFDRNKMLHDAQTKLEAEA
jgi:cytosine permease